MGVPMAKVQKKPHCPGSAITVGNYIEKTTAHIHPSDPEAILAAKAVEKVIETARGNPSLKTSELLKSWSKDTSHPALRSKSLCFKTMERKIQRVKAKALVCPGVPRDFKDLEKIPIKYLLTFDDERYMLANIEQGDERLIIYSSRFGLNLLKRADVWGMDGTFEMCPHPFYKVYTVMAELDGHSYPALHAFLPGKKSQTYKALFAEMAKHLPADEVAVSTLAVDFEVSVHKEFGASYSNVHISGCFFHLKQKMYKKLCSFADLKSLYSKDKEFNIFVNSVVGLAFVPPGKVTGKKIHLYTHK